MWLPSQTALAAEVAAYQGVWLDHFPYRQNSAWHFQTDIFLNWGLWRAGGLMLVGLALYRQGFLRGALEAKTYRNLLLVLLPIGFALTITGYRANEAAECNFHTLCCLPLTGTTGDHCLLLQVTYLYSAIFSKLTYVLALKD